MSPATLISLGMMVAGGVAAARTVARSRHCPAGGRSISVVVDHDDAQAVAIRAGLPFCELLSRCRASGATHCSLPELTLHSLLSTGRLFQTVPHQPFQVPAPVGHWNYLASADAELVQRLAAEMAVRIPQVRPQPMPAERTVLAFGGDLPTVGSIGLGFERQASDDIHRSGLLVVPRPVCYDWPEPALIRRTLAQAAVVGDGVVAFDGTLILGHELHLDETLGEMEANDLTFAFFAESRHQRGDWFIAKRRTPRVVVAHQFTPAQMIPEDYHSIAHRWAALARERGVRMMFVNFFRAVHAAKPLECLSYLEHLREAIERKGFTLSVAQPAPEEAKDTPHPRSDGVSPPAAHAAATGRDNADLALVGLVPAAAGALVVGNVMRLGQSGTAALAAGSALFVAATARRLDRPRSPFERRYAPTYSSKLLALGTAALAPLAVTGRESGSSIEALAISSVTGASAAAALAALTSSDEYRLRVEEYKGFDLDLWIPLAGTMITDARRRHDVAWLAGALAAGAAGWLATRRLMPDPLTRFDAAPASSHTHHLSSAMRALGDVALAFGPRPMRKWSWLAPFGTALSIGARRRGLLKVETAAALLSAAGHAAALSGFRRPERDVWITTVGVAKSWLAGLMAGLIMAAVLHTPDGKSKAVA